MNRRRGTRKRRGVVDPLLSRHGKAPERRQVVRSTYPSTRVGTVVVSRTAHGMSRCSQTGILHSGVDLATTSRWSDNACSRGQCRAYDSFDVRRRASSEGIRVGLHGDRCPIFVELAWRRRRHDERGRGSCGVGSDGKYTDVSRNEYQDSPALEHRHIGISACAHRFVLYCFRSSLMSVKKKR